MKARFGGTCPRCRKRIEVGEEITRLGIGYGDRYGHPTCEAVPFIVEAPRPAREVAVTEPGVYKHDGQVFVVKANRQKTRLYAKRLVEIGGERLAESGDTVHIDFVYEPGAIFALRPEDQMTVEDAKPLMVRYGRCIACGAFLKDRTSVERGIGPVCIKKFRRPVGVAA